MEQERLFLVVCEGSSDFALIEGIIEDAGQRLGRSFHAELIAPEFDATRDQYKQFGWTQVKNWCQGNAKRIGPILTLRRAHGLFIHMDTDIAEEIAQDGEKYHHATMGISRRRWCACAMNHWLDLAKSHSDLHLLLPTHQIENWLLAAFADADMPKGFIPPPDQDFQTIANVESWLVQAGFTMDRNNPNRIYKEKTLYQKKYLPSLLDNQQRVGQRCREFDYFQRLLDGYAQAK